MSSFGNIEEVELQEPAKSRSRLAIAALICSLIVCCPLITIFGPILGIAALCRMKHNQHLSGKGIAISGIVIGAIATICCTLVIFALGSIFINFIDKTSTVTTATINSGYDGCLTCFRKHLTTSSALVTDEEIQEFISTLESRYGEFDSAFLNLAEQNQSASATQTEAPIPMRFVFETTDAEGLIMFEFVPSGELFDYDMKISCIKIEDATNGDIIFPKDSICAPSTPSTDNTKEDS